MAGVLVQLAGARRRAACWLVVDALEVDVLEAHGCWPTLLARIRTTSASCHLEIGIRVFCAWYELARAMGET